MAAAAIHHAAPRLAKLLPLLGSDKPGEVVATANAIGRALKSCGADWHDLASMLDQGDVQPEPVRIAPRWQTLSPADRLRWLDALARPGSGATPWECSIAANIAERLRSFPFTTISPRQQTAINQALAAAHVRGVRP